MNAVVMDGAVIAENSHCRRLLFRQPPLNAHRKAPIAGTPAKVIRAVTDDELCRKTRGTAEYHALVTRSSWQPQTSGSTDEG